MTYSKVEVCGPSHARGSSLVNWSFGNQAEGSYVIFYNDCYINDIVGTPERIVGTPGMESETAGDDT